MNAREALGRVMMNFGMRTLHYRQALVNLCSDPRAAEPQQPDSRTIVLDQIIEDLAVIKAHLQRGDVATW